MHPPSGESRKQCWEARDAYFACLDERELWLDGFKPLSYTEVVELDFQSMKKPSHSLHNLKRAQASESKGSGEPNLASLQACRMFREMYESKCLPSWVMHFSTERLSKLKANYLANKLESDRISVQTDQEFWQRVKRPEAGANGS